MFDDETIDYFVVVNDEEQYSIWPAHREVPAGWSTVGEARSREECLAHIELTWTDMRPRSVREAIAAASAGGAAMILSQLVDAEELEGLSPEELRDMLLALDDELLFGDDEVIEVKRS